MQRRPRIYIVIGTFHPLIGGAESQAQLQGKSLRERGYEATIVTFRHRKRWPQHDQVEGVPVVRIAGALLDGRARYPRIIQQLLYLFAMLVLIWTLWRDRHCYDIIHLYQLSSLTLPTALACRLTGKPMLVSLRSTGLEKPRAGRNATASLLAGPLDPTTPWLQVNGLTWIDGDMESLLRLGKPAVWLTHSLLKRNSSQIIILSSRMKQYLSSKNFLLPSTCFIPNGVDRRIYYPLQSQQIDKTHEHTVVCISRLRYEKGIDVLLQAWRLVQQHDPLARLIIVGGGPLKQQFLSMTEALGIAGSVEFAGIQNDVAGQVRRGGLAVLPSRWEGMPNALLEAMACGLPCVATRVSGSEDIIEHGVNGLLVDVEDYHALADALLTLLHNPVLTSQYGRAALATIEQRYSLDHITDLYLDLYQNILKQHLHPEQTQPDSSISSLHLLDTSES
jgi:glycosyltransferase involved in cell wall biosynthesis